MARPVAKFDHRSASGGDRTGGTRAGGRPGDRGAVEELLGLLARAVQQLHTYPSTSAMCIGAVEACQHALVTLPLRDRLTCHVTPSELIVDGTPFGKGTLVGTELARRLHRSSAAALTIDRSATAREIGRFCEALVHAGSPGGPSLSERLAGHGVERVSVQVARRPEVLEVPCAQPAAEELQRERARWEAQLSGGAVIHHLYPPQKGWVRLDPASAPAAMSLLDLAVLADDPGALATMLLRLTDEAGHVPVSDALSSKYGDVAMLIGSLDAPVARRLFAKLARAVLDLEPGRRQALLRGKVLPGLLEGRVDGAILHDFPDLDLTESLCLLLDLETAAPEVLTSALSRLELSPERRSTLVPLIEARLREREDESSEDARQATLVRHARELMRVDARPCRTFADYASFDLSMDAAALAALDHIRDAVPSSDALTHQLTCLWHLMCLEPNPEAVGRFLDRSYLLLADLEGAGRGAELPAWLAAYRDLAERFWDSRPDVAAVLTGGLAAFCTPERAVWLADLSQCEPGGRHAAGAIVEALGPALVPPLVDLLESSLQAGAQGRTTAARGRAVAALLGDHAARLAAGIVPLLAQRPPATARVLLRALGAAGAGHEASIAAHVASDDEQVAREALRALARIGTPRAATMVAAAILRQRGAVSVAAEETLWHFPAPEAQRHTRDLLARREFTMSHPQAAERLLERVARAGAADLEPILMYLAPLRFRVWNPALARTARKAHGMLKPAAKAATR